MLKDLCKGFTDLIFPHNCLICRHFIHSNDSQAVLCLACQSGIKSNLPPFCPKCSRHLTSVSNENNPLCHECKKTSPFFDSAWGAVCYNRSMRKLIHLFKYGNKLALRHTFAKLIFSFLNTYRINLDQYDFVVSIPLFPVRMRERGYNQSQILADLVARHYKIDQSHKNLVRVKNTQNQAILTEKERWTNIRGAFKIITPSQFSNKSVLLVDDLLTTGATVSEAARVLKEAKASRVDALTLAIAYSKREEDSFWEDKHVIVSETKSFQHVTP